MIYTLYTEPNAADPADIVVIPDTKAPWALLFPPLWLLRYKLWWPLLVYCLVTLLLLTLLATPFIWGALFVGGLPGLYLYLEGHQLRRYRAERQGMQLDAVIDARDETTAVARFLAARSKNIERPVRSNEDLIHGAETQNSESVR